MIPYALRVALPFRRPPPGPVSPGQDVYWLTIPSWSPTEGTPSSFDVSVYAVNETDITRVAGANTAAFVWNAANKTIDYNGAAGASFSGWQFSAAGQNGPAISNTVSGASQAVSNVSWLNIPPWSPSAGAPASYDIAAFALNETDITRINGANGSGFTWNNTTKKIDFDGTSGGSFANWRFRATGPGGPVDSADVSGAAVTAMAVASDYVQLTDLTEGPNWINANENLKIKWENAGGDWWDANDAQQGATAYASATVSSFGAQSVSWAVGSLIQKMRWRAENTGILLKLTSGSAFFNFASSRNPTYAAPALTVVTDAGTFQPPLIADLWIDVSGGGLGQNVATREKLAGTVLLKFDLSAIPMGSTVSAATLTMYLFNSGGSVPFTVGAFRLRMPEIIWDPARQIGRDPTKLFANGLAASVANSDVDLTGQVLVYNTFESDAEVYTGVNGHGDQWPPNQPVARPGTFPGHITGQWTIDPLYVPWPEYGLTAGRVTILGSVSNPPGTNTGVVAHHWVTPKNPTPFAWQRDEGAGYEQMYCRYLLYLDPDVTVNMHPNGGVKLPGMAGTYGQDNSGQHIPNPSTSWWSYRLEHFMPSVPNPGFVRLFLYAYDYQNNAIENPGGGTGNPLLGSLNMCLKTGKRYSIDQYVKLNTFNSGAGTWNSDGIIKVWVDGVLVTDINNRQIRRDPIIQIQSIPFVNVYHGGVDPPTRDIHYQITGVAAHETSYIGPPKRVKPQWVKNLPLWQWYSVPNTAPNLVGEPSILTSAPSGGIDYGVGANRASARLTAWSGPSMRRKGSIMLLGPAGGHGDYYANWITQFVFGAETPYIELLDAGSPWQALVNVSEYYLDGKPSVTHTYNSLVFCEQRDWHMQFGVATINDTALVPPPSAWPFTIPNGYENSIGVAAYDYANRRWMPPRHVPQLPRATNGNFTAAPYAVHPYTGDVYCGFNGDSNAQLYRWNQLSNTWTSLAANQIIWNYQAAAIDPVNNVMLNSGTYEIPSFPPSHYDLTTGVRTTVTFNGAAAAEVATTGGASPMYPRMDYDLQQNCFVFCRPGADGKVDIYTLTRTGATSYDVVKKTVTGTRPDNPVNGIETKFQYAPELGGWLLMNSYSENVKFIRTTL